MIRVEAVEPREFPDTSLGVPEPDTMYAPVVVPGYAITLGVGDETFVYHAGDGRVVAVPEGPGGAPPSAPEDGV